MTASSGRALCLWVHVTPVTYKGTFSKLLWHSPAWWVQTSVHLFIQISVWGSKFLVTEYNYSQKSISRNQEEPRLIYSLADQLEIKPFSFQESKLYAFTFSTYPVSCHETTFQRVSANMLGPYGYSWHQHCWLLLRVWTLKTRSKCHKALS